MAEHTDLITVVILVSDDVEYEPSVEGHETELPRLWRVFRNVSYHHPTIIAAKSVLPFEIEEAVGVPIVIDRWPNRGPLSGVMSAMREARTPWVFACSAKRTSIDDAFIERLWHYWHPGDEALVATRDADNHDEIAPYASLYRREPFMREGMKQLIDNDGDIRHLIPKLKTRYVPVGPEGLFAERAANP
jgi:molybdopterin-guanine dinucleotide biosynthesis protein A